MTINVTRVMSPDLFVENASLKFDQERASQLFCPIPKIGAITFVAAKSEPSQDLGSLAMVCGREAISLTSRNNYRIWTFLADGPWQTPSRIAKHNKLWKKHLNFVKSNGVLKTSDEVRIESTDGIRFAGMAEVSSETIAPVLELARTNTASAIVCSKNGCIDSPDSVQFIFQCAFPISKGLHQGRVDWMTLALNLCPLGDILVRVNGLFDDKEVAVDVIAAQEVISKLG